MMFLPSPTESFFMSRTNKNQTSSSAKSSLRIKPQTEQDKKSDRPKDRLVELIQCKILAVSPDEHQVDRFIYEVVGDYMSELMAQGFIPQQLLDTLENDLKEEAIEIYRKTTYGHMSLKDYQQRQSDKKTSKGSNKNSQTDKVSKAK